MVPLLSRKHQILFALEKYERNSAEFITPGASDGLLVMEPKYRNEQPHSERNATQLSFGREFDTPMKATDQVSFKMDWKASGDVYGNTAPRIGRVLVACGMREIVTHKLFCSGAIPLACKQGSLVSTSATPAVTDPIGRVVINPYAGTDMVIEQLTSAPWPSATALYYKGPDATTYSALGVSTATLGNNPVTYAYGFLYRPATKLLFRLALRPMRLLFTGAISTSVTPGMILANAATTPTKFARVMTAATTGVSTSIEVQNISGTWANADTVFVWQDGPTGTGLFQGALGSPISVGTLAASPTDRAWTYTPVDGDKVTGATSGSIVIARKPTAPGSTAALPFYWFMHPQQSSGANWCGTRYDTSGGGETWLVPFIPLATDEAFLIGEPVSGRYLNDEDLNVVKLSDGSTVSAAKKTVTTGAIHEYLGNTSASIYSNLDGTQRGMVGARGNMKLTMKAGEPVVAEFEFLGCFDINADAPFLESVSYGSDTTIPQIVSFWPSDVEIQAAGWEVDLGNSVVPRVSMTYGDGIKAGYIADRLPTISVDYEATHKSVVDWLGRLRSAITYQGNNAVSERYQDNADSAGERIAVWAPMTQVMSIEDTEGDGIARKTVKFACRRWSVTGEDEIAFWLN